MEAAASVATTTVVRSAVPTFLVNDVAATARWYVEHLGFELAGFFPGVENGAGAANKVVHLLVGASDQGAA